MKKILSVTLISALTLVLSTGCSSKTAEPQGAQKEDLTIKDKVGSDALYTEGKSNGAILHAIEKAGSKTGWQITKFKGNEVMAEKISDGETVSADILFYDGHVEFHGADTSDLRDAIEDELSHSGSSH